HEDDAAVLGKRAALKFLQVRRGGRPQRHPRLHRFSVQHREPLHIGPLGLPDLYPFASCTCLSSALSTCDPCWLPIACPSRWPLDETRPRMWTSSSPFTFVPEP